MIIIEKVENNGKQKIFSKEFVSNTLCYTQSKRGDFVYLLEDEMLYICNHDAKLLEALDTDSKRNQIDQLKNLLPDIKIERADTGSEEKIIIRGRSVNAVILGEAISSKIDGLADTCYQKSREFSNQFGIFTMPTKENEIISDLNIYINIQGNINKTNSSITKIANLKVSDIPREILEIENDYKKIKVIDCL